MKKLLIALLIGACSAGTACWTVLQAKQEGFKETIAISGAWALYPMVIKWSEEFQKIRPDVKIDVSAGGAGKGMADALVQAVDLGMVSRELYPAEIEKGAWWVSVTKDAVVATFNENNPVSEDLLAKGVKQDMLIGIWITQAIKDWGEVIQAIVNYPIHVYSRSDACGAAETWARFLGNKKQEDLQGVGVYGDPGLAEAVRKDILGIGYNNINYAYDAKTKKQLTGIRVLPIDINENGKIDEDENFYNIRDEIAKAINAGKYPSPPARDLYFVSKGRPQKKIVVEFINWVLTEGQNYVTEAGYINLDEDKIQEQLKKLKR